MRNTLAPERERRGWTQGRLAEAVGISRQSYSSIEAGRTTPSTEIALRLARVLGVPVETLFRLPDPPAEQLRARGAIGVLAVGARVRLSRVAGEWVAYEAGDGERSVGAADGVVRRVEGDELWVSLVRDRPLEADLTVVGCDPAFAIVAEWLRRERGIEVVWRPLASVAALEALARGEAHVAGAHLRDPESGESNGRWVRASLTFPCTRVVFAEWEQGILVPTGNPAGIRGVADLSRPDLRIVNRELGSGSRILLDEELAAAGVPTEAVRGYGSAARGHLAVGEAIATGLADAGIAIRAAGVAYGLEVQPIRWEPYELIVPDHFLDLPAVGALLEALRRPEIRSQVELLEGYDVGRMGSPA